MLYEGIYSYEEVDVKNTTEKEMTVTGQHNTVVVENTTWKEFSKKNYRMNCVYYDVVNMDTGQYHDVKDKEIIMVTYIGLDSRASEVNGVQTLDIYK